MTCKKSSKIVTPNTDRWEAAVADARTRLTANKRQAAKLRNAIRCFEENLAVGAPWPETVAPLREGSGDGDVR